MKANLMTKVLPMLTAAISCTLSLAAGATDNDSSSDNDRHFSSNFTPVVNEVRKAVLNLSKKDLDNYGKVLRTPCVTGPDFGAMGVHLINHEFVDGVVDPNKPEARARMNWKTVALKGNTTAEFATELALSALGKKIL